MARQGAAARAARSAQPCRSITHQNKRKKPKHYKKKLSAYRPPDENAQETSGKQEQKSSHYRLLLVHPPFLLLISRVLVLSWWQNINIPVCAFKRYSNAKNLRKKLLRGYSIEPSSIDKRNTLLPARLWRLFFWASRRERFRQSPGRYRGLPPSSGLQKAKRG